MTDHSAEYAKIECLLFVSGEPVLITELARVLCLSKVETLSLLKNMEADYTAQGRGVLPFVTEDTVQLISNRAYIGLVEDLLQPEKTRSVSKSMLETLAVVAYRQPCTRADIEEVRGVRCEYAVSKLTELGLIAEVGRKDTLGRPALFGTTDTFLRKFGLHSLDELKDFSLFTGAEDLKV